MMESYGYPDLTDSEFVYEALLGHGMFSHLLPPCFSSEKLFYYIAKNPMECKKNRAWIEYKSLKNTMATRNISIPYPDAYAYLCKVIKEQWNDINLHIGKQPYPKKKSMIHVRKFKGESYIYKFDYTFHESHIFKNKPVSKLVEVDLINEYAVGSEYKVKADISKCFPSIYSHSIVWAMCGKQTTKEWAMSRDKENEKYKHVNKFDKLDKASMSIKEGETNGLLIGPHTSNIISEIILTKIDRCMHGKGYENYIRYIDDYKFYAKDENQAHQFLSHLRNVMAEYELNINDSKTEIIKLPDSENPDWIIQLNRFIPEKELEKDGQEIHRFHKISYFLDIALNLAKDKQEYEIINYAIKIIAGFNLTESDKNLCLRRIFHIVLCYPYLAPVVEKVIKKFYDSEKEKLKDAFSFFVSCLLEKSIMKNYPSSAAFSFYYARKYNLNLKVEKNAIEGLLEMKDCISLLLALAYFDKMDKESKQCLIRKIKEKFDNFKDKRTREQFWILVYEFIDDCLDKEDDSFLLSMKKEKIGFLK